MSYNHVILGQPQRLDRSLQIPPDELLINCRQIIEIKYIPIFDMTVPKLDMLPVEVR